MSSTKGAREEMASRVRILVVFAVVAVTLAISVHNGSSAESEAASDRFWGHFRVTGSPVEHYDDLVDLARSSDTVVLGRISGVEPGRTFGSEDSGFVHYASAIVVIDETIASSIPLDDMLVLELMVGGGGERLVLDPREVPDEQVLLFLRNKGREASMLGWSAQAQRQEAQYFRRAVSEGVFRNKDGDVSLLGEYEHRYVREWQGRSFEELLAFVRAARRAAAE
jgi:hypothetical protein